MMNTCQKTHSKVVYENTLSSVVDGFVAQVIFAMTNVTEVVKGISGNDELIYRNSDDQKEMQVQMMVDYHLQKLDAVLRNAIVEYVKTNKMLLSDERKILLELIE